MASGAAHTPSPRRSRRVDGVPAVPYSTEGSALSQIEKVHDAGGWKRYAQAHRKHLAAMFASKLGLPADVLSLVVDFWGAHVGMYAIDAGATIRPTKEEVENVENGRKSGPCTIA